MPSVAATSASTALRIPVWVAESCRGLLLSTSMRDSLSHATGSKFYVTVEGPSAPSGAAEMFGLRSFPES